MRKILLPTLFTVVFLGAFYGCQKNTDRTPPPSVLETSSTGKQLVPG